MPALMQCCPYNVQFRTMLCNLCHRGCSFYDCITACRCVIHKVACNKKKGCRASRAVFCVHMGEREAEEEEGSYRSSEADREVCVYTSSNTNRRCRLDKEIKGKGATQINLSFLSSPSLYRKRIREREMKVKG